MDILSKCIDPKHETESSKEWKDIQTNLNLREVVQEDRPLKCFFVIEFDPDLNPTKSAAECIAEATVYLKQVFPLAQVVYVSRDGGKQHEIRFPQCVVNSAADLALMRDHLCTSLKTEKPAGLRVLRSVDGAVREQWLFCFDQKQYYSSVAIERAHGPQGLIHQVSPYEAPFPVQCKWKRDRCRISAELEGQVWHKDKGLFAPILATLFPDAHDPIDMVSVTLMFKKGRANKLLPNAIRIALATHVCHVDKAQPKDHEMACTSVDVREDGSATLSCECCNATRTWSSQTLVNATSGPCLQRVWGKKQWMKALNKSYTQLATGAVVERMINEFDKPEFVSRKKHEFKQYLDGHTYIDLAPPAKPKKKQKNDEQGAAQVADPPEWRLYNAASMWLCSLDRAQCKQVTFNAKLAPGRRDAEFLNMYEGYGMEAKPPASGKLDDAAPLLRKHIFEVLCNGDEVAHTFLETCLSQLVRFPWIKLGVVHVFRSKQGAGKNTPLDVICKIFGHHGVEVTNPRHVTGNFNQHLQNKIFVMLNEAVWGGDKQAEGILKASITDSMAMFESKGVDARVGLNFWSFFLLSNEKWCIPATPDGRCYTMYDVSDEYVGNAEYFTALHKAIAAGEDREYMWYLINRECPDPHDWRPEHNMPPRTKAIVDQMFQDRSLALLRFLCHKLQEDGEWISAAGTPIIQTGKETKVYGNAVLQAVRNEGENDVHLRNAVSEKNSLARLLKDYLGEDLFQSGARFLTREIPEGQTNDKCYKFASAEEIMEHLSTHVLKVPNYFAQ